MDRRRFLRLSAMGTAALHPALRAQSAAPVGVTLGNPTGRGIAEGFIGLSYESAQLSDPAFFSGDNQQLLRFFHGLGEKGVLRIGGNTSEYCFWKQDPRASGISTNPIQDALGPDKGNKTPPRRVITEQAILNLHAFLYTLQGWSLIYGLNLGLGTPDMAVEEAAYVSRVIGPQLLAYQLANEPDLFSRNGLRPPGYGPDQFIEEWRSFFDAVRRRIPGAIFAGPDTAGDTAWIAPFASAFHNDVRFLSSHYYAEGPPSNPAMDIPRLLRPDPRLDREFAALQQTGMPFRMTETNSCYGGGKQGVSNTFAAALWGADYMLRIAQAGGRGVNFHGGGYGWYTPVAGTRAKGFEARPLYYGMLLVRQAGPGQLLDTQLTAAPPGLRVYGIRRFDGPLRLIALNLSLDQPVDLALDPKLSGKRVLRLKAPAASATSGVTLGDAAVNPDGSWRPTASETAAAQLHLPAASGVILI